MCMETALVYDSVEARSRCSAVEGMELSSLKSLVNNITCLQELAGCENINTEPAEKYHSKVEELLKLLKPIFQAFSATAITSDVKFEQEITGLRQTVDELRKIFDNWQPLKSKIYFVLQVEPLVAKVQSHGMEILELLVSSDHSLPPNLGVSSLELCTHKIEHMGFEQILPFLIRAINSQMEGSGIDSECLAKISDSLSLNSNQDLLIEAVALEDLKENAEQAEKIGKVENLDQMISLVSHMHDLLVSIKHSENCNPVSIPLDFCCPLSLELMTDPVIVSSGQTYERSFISKWIDLGLTVCPKTWQNLAHTNLTPNYTVKALIANWCETNNVKLLDPAKSINLNQSSSLITNGQSGAAVRVISSNTPDLSIGSTSPFITPFSSSASQRDRAYISQPRSLSEGSLAETSVNSNHLDLEISQRNSGDKVDHSGEKASNLVGLLLKSPSANDVASTDEWSLQNHCQTNSTPTSHSDSSLSQGTDTTDVSGEIVEEPQPYANSRVPRQELDFQSRLQTRTHGPAIWRKPSERFAQKVISYSAVEASADVVEVETEVKKLIDVLKGSSIDMQIKATEKIRLLAKDNMDNRIVIVTCGAINLLIDLLYSTNLTIQQNAVTALLNLSLNDNNKRIIGNAEVIAPLIHVLETGSPEAKENSAATFFSLSMTEENKIKIGNSGAIISLVDLLGNGTPRAKKDVASALYYLSIVPENKSRIVQAGAVKHLIELMDPAFGMVDKAVAVLSNLANTHEGRMSIGQENGIPALVEVVELGSVRSKENAAAALLQLCSSSSRFCKMVIRAGATPSLVALCHSGTPRAKEKAQQLINFFKNKRQGHSWI